jgi:hypothetical protein
LTDGGAIESIGFDDICSSKKVGFMDLCDDLRLGNVEQVIVILH